MIEPLGVPWQRVGKLAVRSLSQAFTNFQPDIVYCFGQIRTLWWARAARRAGIPVVIGAERGSGTRWINRIGRSLDKRTLDGYITNSHTTAGVLKDKIRIRPELVHVIRNGLSIDSGEPPLLNPQWEFGSPTVVCVANIRPMKGQMILLRSVASLRDEFPNLRAVLVGRDLTNGQFAKQAASVGLSDTYTWTGFLPNVRAVLDRGDLFVLPSRLREGLPTSILEAMQAGIPVIGTDVGGVRELIVPGKTGILIEPDNVDALASAIRTMLSAPDTCHRFGEAGRQLVESEFTIERMVEKHCRVFREILDSKNEHSEQINA
ncbi:glycosyltransferase family 4 protein [Adhaeretor mobilis]|nr:glycosyltransferase family 4 protein [Adhaeretor mobilis]